MKQFFTFKRQVTFTLLLCSCCAFGQTFQNTFQPVRDDNYAAGVAVNKFYWSIGNTNSFTPSVGTNHILFSKYNSGGASVWDRKYYDGAMPAIQFTATDIQAGYAQFTISPGNSNPPLPCVLNLCPAPGTAVNVVNAPGSQNYFYVSGFYFDPAFNVRRLLIMQLSSAGAVLWARTNVLAAGNVYDEAGISVESCPNGDVMAVSTVYNGTISFPAVTRMDNAGNLLWRFHYPPSPNEQPYNFIPHQSCVFKEKVPNIVNSPTGIAITGECTNPANPGPQSFFVMRIAYNGGMIWKFNYPSSTAVNSHDIGWDIMCEAEAVGAAATVDNFVVTGLTNAAGTGPVVGALGFVARVSSTTGAFVSCNRFGIPTVGAVPTQTTYGQGIYQSTSAPANIVVTGGVDDPATGIITDTYLLEMNIITGSQVSAHHYSLTTPNYPHTESVVSVGSAYPTPGFYITTNSNNTYGATLTDGHVIKTDLSGRVNSLNCPSDTLIFGHDSVGVTIVTRCTEQHCDIVTSKPITMKKLNAPHVLCYSATKLTDEEALLNISDGEIAVYPNPVSGKEITMLFPSGEPGEYSLRIMNVNGDIVQELNVVFDESGGKIPVSIDQLPEGMYIIMLSNGKSTYDTKFIKMK